MRKRKFFLLGVVSILVSLSGGNVLDLGRSIPKKILMWQADGKDAVYDRKTLFDYMDGGAEVFLAFDFQEAFVRKYRGADKDEIALDIYEMGTPEEAFGIFSCDRQDPEAGIGQESEYGPGLLRFRQGRYFVTITAAGDEKKAEKAILELGRLVAPLLGPPGGRPALLQCLPEPGLRREKTSFFHSSVNLNNRFFVSSENIFGLGAGTDCVFAEYGSGPAERANLLVIRYPNENAARAAYRSFGEAYLPQGADAGAAPAPDGSWTVARVQTNFVCVVFRASSKGYADRLQNAVRLPQK